MHRWACKRYAEEKSCESAAGRFLAYAEARGPCEGAKRTALASLTTGNETKKKRFRFGPRHKHDKWIFLIGVLKLLKAVLFVSLGVGAIQLLHKDLVDLLTRAAIELRFDPESDFVNMLLDKVALINDHRLVQISAAIFCYAALDVVEGVGLVLEKAWAEYLTLILTASFLPWELFEIAKRATSFRIGLTIVNALVVIYLVFHVRGRMRLRQAAQSSDEEN